MSRDEMRGNLNTILLTATIGLLGWMTYTTHETSVNVAKMATAQETADRDLLELRARVTRIEIDFAALQARAAALH